MPVSKARASLISRKTTSARIVLAADTTAPARLERGKDLALSSLPAATLLPNELTALNSASTPLPDLGKSSKVIKVEALKLPPTSQPLPQWMQNVTISDEQLKSPTKSSNTRLAQNSAAPPLRQPQHPVTSTDRLPNQIEVATSTYVVLVTKVDLSTVAIADPNIADVTIVNARSVLVNGKSSGVTTLVVVDRQGKIRQYQVRVVPIPGARDADIARLIGIEGVSVRRVQDAIILEGEVASAEEMQRATDIASIFSSKIVNQLRVRGGEVSPAALTATQIQEAINRPDVQVRVVGKKAILDGTVTNETERQRAEQVARTYVDDVLNLLQLPTLSVEQVREILGGEEASAAHNNLDNGTYGEFRAAQPLVVRRIGDQIALEGILPSQAEVDNALATASRTGLQVVNRLAVAPAPPTEAALLRTVAQTIGIPGVRVRGNAKRLVLEGTVPDTNSGLRAGQIAHGFAANVDNMLVTASPTQVNVNVTVVEINRDALKNLGVEFAGLNGGVGDVHDGVDIGHIGVGGGSALGAKFPVTLRAQIGKGAARLLANPRTTVLSGHTASFQVGGQFPVPVNAQITDSGAVTISIEFKDFGILMDVTPVANSEGAITMRVRTDISQLAPDLGSITIPGTDVTIPAFTRRAAVTEVTTRSGGTIALSGLINDEVRKVVNEIPVLSKIPILGSLFKSKRFQHNESDLVIFVTPRVVENPLLPGTSAPVSVVAEGPSTIAPITLGNPGIQTFSTIGGAGIQPGNNGEGGGSGTGQ
jgi:Flp pilus assembly secretin CpaC